MATRQWVLSRSHETANAGQVASKVACWAHFAVESIHERTVLAENENIVRRVRITLISLTLQLVLKTLNVALEVCHLVVVIIIISEV